MLTGRRPLPGNEPQYPPGLPKRPSGMSAGARKIWDTLVSEMAASGVLRTVNALALMQLCEDQAMLDTLRRWVPHTFAAFMEYRLGGAQVSATGLAIIKRLLAGEAVTAETSGLSKREWRELMATLGRGEG